MANVLKILFGLTLISCGKCSTCFCQGLSFDLKSPCRFGEKIRDQVKDNSLCYEHCDWSFIKPVQVAACFKGCLSEDCVPQTPKIGKNWSDSIRRFFKPRIQKEMAMKAKVAQSVLIVDNDQQHASYALYINGEPVITKQNMRLNNSHVVSYVYVSWSVFEHRTDLCMTLLAIMCFILGVILLVSPCLDDDDVSGDHSKSKTEVPKKTEKSTGHFKKNIEKQDFVLDVDNDLRKALLDVVNQY